MKLKLHTKTLHALTTATVAAVYVAMASSPSYAADSGAGALRLLSYNVRHCSGKENQIHYSQTAAAIHREAPDFVGLQEIDVGTKRSKGIDQGVSDRKPVFVSVSVAGDRSR